MNMHGTHIEDLSTRIRPRTASNILLWGVTAFVLIFFIWAAFAELERTVRGMGRVVPSSQLQVVSNLEGGIVEQILVRQGQQVRAGDELIRLDPTLTTAEFGSGEATLSALSVKIARLQAEVEGRSPTYPSAVSAAVADQIRIEQALHASRMADLAGVLGAAQARLTQAQRSVGEAQGAYEARVAARDARQAEVRIIRPLVQRGIEPRLSLIQAESAAEETLSRVGLEWRAQAANELATAQAELAARRRSLPALANRVERTVVRAPLPGRINRVLVTTRGGSVQPGQPLVEIVPSDESLLVEARITPEDIAFVSLNQAAKVAITAYDRAVYGSLDARVVSISPDAILDEQTGQTYYLIRVRTTENMLRDPRGRPMPIGPGMVAEVDVIGDTRTVLQYILSPITKLGETALREQ
jgi:adhesin transport system membrane fusion protein